MSSKTIHRQKLFGGRTAEEVHAKYAFPINAKCAGCGGRPMIRAIVMMELSEARRTNPLIEQMMVAEPEAFMQQIVQIKGSDGKAVPYFRCSVVYSCKSCRREMEKALAKAPSHCIVEINDGPGPDKVVA